MGTRMAWNAVLYRGTAGSNANTAMTNVRDVKLPFSVVEADISTRASRYQKTDVGLFVTGIDWDMLADESDSDFSAVWNAFVAGTAISLKALGVSTGSGIGGDFVIVKCEIDQKLKESNIANVSAKPTKGTLTTAFVTGS